MKTTLLFVFSLLTFAVFAQSARPQHRIVLASGEIISGEKLNYDATPGQKAQFELDGLRYGTDEVRFFQNNHGYFANVNRVNGPNQERYALRIKKAKLSLYEEIDIEVYAGEDLKTEAEPGKEQQDPLLASGKMYEYYQMNDGDQVRKATYSNLSIDLKDNAASMKHLDTYKKYRWLQFAMIGIGSGIIAGDVLRQSGGPVTFNPFMAFGFVVGGSSYFMETPKRDALWLAADAYNSEEEPVVSN